MVARDRRRRRRLARRHGAGRPRRGRAGRHRGARPRPATRRRRRRGGAAAGCCSCMPIAGWSRAGRPRCAALYRARRTRRRAPAISRFALDDAAPAARRLERIVAWRCRALALPYGDQGLLIARALYDAVGGFARDPADGGCRSRAPPRPRRPRGRSPAGSSRLGAALSARAAISGGRCATSCACRSISPACRRAHIARLYG